MTANPKAEQEDDVVTIAVRKRTPETKEATESSEVQSLVNVEHEKEELSPTRGVTIQPLSHAETPESPAGSTEELTLEKKSESFTPDTKRSEKDQKQAEVDSALVVAELVNSKKYFLPIKEKHASSVFRLEQTKKRLKTTAPKKKKSVADPKIPKVIKKNSTSTTLGLLLSIILIVAGVYLAIDFKLVDVGWTPPFSIANR